jgi:hypothetical protein
MPDTTVNAQPPGITLTSTEMTPVDQPTRAGVNPAGRVNRADTVLNGLSALIPSELPALVFTSLAALSVPLFSDRCQIFVEEDGLAGYRIERPVTGAPPASDAHHRLSRVRNAWSGQWVSKHGVQTSFSEAATATDGGFRGSVLHLWNPHYRPTGTDLALAQLLVDNSIALLRRERARVGAEP